MVMRKGAFDVVKSRRESNVNGRITFPKRPFSVDFPGSYGTDCGLRVPRASI